VKKILSILLLALFCCQQYGKVFAYLNCKVYSYYTGDKNCGCEDSLAGNSANDAPLQPLVSKEKIEEPFIPVAPVISVAATTINGGAHYSRYLLPPLSNWQTAILHPPQG
jgi:hypothetical protein